MGLPGGPDGKEFTCNARTRGDPGSVPGLGRCPGAGNGSPLEYSCLENHMDRTAWQATVHGLQNQTRLNDFHFASHMNTWTALNSFTLLVLEGGTQIRF